MLRGPSRSLPRPRSFLESCKRTLSSGPRSSRTPTSPSTEGWSRRSRLARPRTAGFRGRLVDTGKPQHDPGAGMGRIALDAGLELGGHGADDTLPHAGGARVGLRVAAAAAIGDRKNQIVVLRGE